MFNGNQDSLPPPFSFNWRRVVKDNVWFTYKARIKAHGRLEWMDLHSQLLLVWYAILSAVLAILTIRYPAILGADTDILSAVLSVGLLAISLSVTNRDFRGRAMLMRSNYLHLQQLYNSMSGPAISPGDLAEYSRLLRDCENHTSVDDIIARLSSTNLTSRKPQLKEAVLGYGALFLRYLVTIALYVAPIWIGLSFQGVSK